MFNKSQFKTPVRTLLKDEIMNTFKEINLGYTEEEAINEANRCLNCKNAPCIIGCPLHNDIPKFISLIKEKKYLDSYEILLKTSGFSSVCSRVCYQDMQCEKNCNRKKNGQSVSIGALERFVSEQYTLLRKKYENKPQIGKVAVIGSGPSGLACAYYLARNNVKVDVYEQKGNIGGLLSYGIPKYRLPKKVIDDLYLEYIDMGISFYLNYEVTNENLKSFKKQYNYIYLAPGASISKKMDILGENILEVIPWDAFLENVNNYRSMFNQKKIGVIGGGNVAIDCARSSIRLNPTSVEIIYRRTKKEMPANNVEIEDAINEGVKFNFLRNPKEIIKLNNGIKVITSVMKLGLPDDSGRFLPIETDEIALYELDYLIMAIGSVPCSDFINENLLNKNRLVKVDENLKTIDDVIYAGGDIVLGSKTVVEAVSMGNKAAQNIIDNLTKK